MIMTDEAWYIVRNTPGVTGFIGSSGGGAKPFPVAEEEMESILRRLGMSERKVQIDFAVGDRVRILSGAFANVEGTVEELHEDSQTAVVLTILFGRENTNRNRLWRAGESRAVRILAIRFFFSFTGRKSSIPVFKV